ncbi:bloodthirsty-related gene family, member 30 [Amia ocellicauda]|uniref:bloodthirsty-related gene family, member 30 n=1 Tax=Amia ocellicauda TaxID=2972642 RepID=UPI0034641568
MLPLPKMAEAGNPLLCSEQELTCSICLDIFTDPVSTPCGHNFCQLCIGGYWSSSEVSTCPLCKRVFQGRPELSINRVFSMIAESYKEASVGPASSLGMGEVAKPGEIACDVCMGRRLRAVRSCLTCTASYCETHLQPHAQNPNFAHHRLLDPQQAFKSRMCKTHHKLLEVFCRNEQVCVCSSCAQLEHRKHRTVSVQAERNIKQRLLGKIETEIQKGIHQRSHKLSELRGTVDSFRNSAQRETAEVEDILLGVIRSAERIRRELVEGIRQKQAAMEARGDVLIGQLEQEVAELQNRHLSLEQLSSSEDHIHFLQSFKSISSPLATEDLSEVSVDMQLSLEEVKMALRDLRERLDNIQMGEVRSPPSIPVSLPRTESMMSLRGLRRREWSLKDLRKLRTGSGVKKIRTYSENITLNPITAYPFLILSDDRKQVKRGEKLQYYRNSPQRYDVWSCVLGKEGFTSGRHYWEVVVGDNKDWKLGVVHESAQRKGLFDMSPRVGYWALWWGGSQLRALTNPNPTKVKPSTRLKHIGVFLDYEEGQVSFYNAKTGSEIYTYSDSFSEKLFPLFGTGDKDVPLIISSLYAIAE